jgi:recombination protein RecR
MTPEKIEKISELLAHWPGIGPRQARRIAFYIADLEKKDIIEIADAIKEIGNIKRCKSCFFIHNEAGENCLICANSKRSKDLVAIVEKETDLITLEKTGKFLGRYLVIGELSKDGILTNTNNARIESFKKSLGGEILEEIIIALSPTTKGDVNASVLTSLLEKSAKKISRLGRGIPTGGEVEFADEETILNSLLNRK